MCYEDPGENCHRPPHKNCRVFFPGRNPDIKAWYLIYASPDYLAKRQVWRTGYYLPEKNIYRLPVISGMCGEFYQRILFTRHR